MPLFVGWSRTGSVVEFGVSLIESHVASEERIAVIVKSVSNEKSLAMTLSSI
ncbi:hypothetical protein [Moraxella oculi]|uniref:Uncharacterized protein n=1 Tax=Moraxella oculi TaxID=2940516 RepID=A0ABW8UBW9_9GAMM